MPYVPCAICGGNDTEVLFTKGDLDRDITNVICKKCALVYINPRPRTEEYETFHHEEFLRERHGMTEVKDVASKIKGRDLEIKMKVFGFLREYVAASSRVLDVGCGFGTLLDIIRRATGAAVCGIELSDLDYTAAKEFYGLDLFHGSLKDFVSERRGETFDVIVLHHTFEHMPEPNSELERMRQLLSPSGVLYIGVPNIMNLKKRPEIFFQLGHAYSYSPHSIRLMLEANGFKIIKFNRRAAFPGAFEVVAARERHPTLAVRHATLRDGASWRTVSQYIRGVQRKFAFFRACRALLFFWMPRRLRQKFSYAVYQTLKRL